MSEQPQQYRKTATILLILQVAEGASHKIETLEGSATGTGGDRLVRANTARGERWFIPNDFFTGPDGYEPTGELVGGYPVYRKKASANAYAVQAGEGAEPIQMRTMDEPVVPPAGHWVVQSINGGRARIIDPEVFATSYEPA
jgi:hypothetical protein